jgi:hypothetical protein
MGLDMYLYKKTYVQQWSFESDEEKHHVTVKKGGKALRHIKPSRVAYVIEQVGYWRKSNQIHRWFVNNVQKGVDDCGEYYVSSDQLKVLMEECNKVIKEPTKGGDVLPTQGGFFFGNTGYDEWYINDLKDTVKMIEGILADEKKYNFKGVYYYHSSW